MLKISSKSNWPWFGPSRGTSVSAVLARMKLQQWQWWRCSMLTWRPWVRHSGLSCLGSSWLVPLLFDHTCHTSVQLLMGQSKHILKIYSKKETLKRYQKCWHAKEELSMSGGWSKSRARCHLHLRRLCYWTQDRSGERKSTEPQQLEKWWKMTTFDNHVASKSKFNWRFFRPIIIITCKDWSCKKIQPCSEDLTSCWSILSKSTIWCEN